MDSHQEDAAGGVLATLVLHERSRLLGAHHIRTLPPFCIFTLRQLLTMAFVDVFYYICKELLYSPF
jgi:hypothetical protein